MVVGSSVKFQRGLAALSLIKIPELLAVRIGLALIASLTAPVGLLRIVLVPPIKV